MASQENNIFNSIRLAVSAVGVRLFRVNTGRAWTGNKITKFSDGSIRIYDPRPFSTGVPPGYSDGSGWHSIEITAEMVGKRVAVFTAIEAKTAKGRLSANQDNFIRQVKQGGGIAGVARSGDEAVQLIKKYVRDLKI